MTIDRVCENIALTEKVFRSLIVTANYSKISENTIGWSNYSSGVFKNLYAKEYELIIRNRQYTFLLTGNRGCIQLYFNFDKEDIQKVKMAYYPYPVGINADAQEYESYLYDTNDERIGEYYFDLWNMLNHQFELTLNDEELQKLIDRSKLKGNDETPENLILGKFESKYEFTNSSHIRVDYDAEVTTHHKCEIQIGAINHIRIPLRKLTTPFVFFDFVAKNLYPEQYNEIAAKQHFNTHFVISKKQSLTIDPFAEENIFLDFN